jgi:hypothetical protein
MYCNKPANLQNQIVFGQIFQEASLDYSNPNFSNRVCNRLALLTYINAKSVRYRATIVFKIPFELVVRW